MEKPRPDLAILQECRWWVSKVAGYLSEMLHHRVITLDIITVEQELPFQKVPNLCNLDIRTLSSY